MLLSRFVFPAGPFASFLDAITACEAQDAATAWVPQVFGWDALTALAVAGTRTSRLRLGTAVLPAPVTHPLAMAAAAMSVQSASSGRFTLGLGASHRFLVETAWGGSYARPVQRMRDYVSALRPAMAGESVDVRTDLLTARTVRPLSLPGAAPPPVLLAALGEKMLALAGEVADGTITWLTGQQTLRDHVIPVLRRSAEAARRPRPRVVAALPVCVTSRRARALELARTQFAAYTQVPSYRSVLDREGVADAADVAVIGDEDHVAERLDEFAAAGVDEFAACVFGDQESVQRTQDLLTRLVRAGGGLAA